MHGKHVIALAKRMFVNEGRSIESIAKEIGASEFTVRNWRNKGKWVEEKESICNGEQLAKDLYSLSVFLKKQVEIQLRETGKVDEKQAKLLIELLPKIENVARVELELKKANKAEENTQSIPDEVKAMPEVKKALAIIAKALEKHRGEK